MLIALALLFAATDDDAAALTRSDWRSCGVDETGLSSEYRPEAQDDETTAKGAPVISDEQMRCLARAAATHGYVIAFDDLTLSDRFAAAYEIAQREVARDQARAGLAAAGLLDRLPIYDPKSETLDGFVVRIERFCGARPRSVLKRTGPKFLTIDPPALRRGVSDRKASRQIACVMQALAANDLKASGVLFAFIGNAPR